MPLVAARRAPRRRRRALGRARDPVDHRADLGLVEAIARAQREAEEGAIARGAVEPAGEREARVAEGAPGRGAQGLRAEGEAAEEARRRREGGVRVDARGERGEELAAPAADLVEARLARALDARGLARRRRGTRPARRAPPRGRPSGGWARRRPSKTRSIGAGGTGTVTTAIAASEAASSSSARRTKSLRGQAPPRPASAGSLRRRHVEADGAERHGRDLEHAEPGLRHRRGEHLRRAGTPRSIAGGSAYSAEPESAPPMRGTTRWMWKRASAASGPAPRLGELEDGDAPAVPRHARHLAERARAVLHVADAERDAHRVDGAVGEIDGLRVADARSGSDRPSGRAFSTATSSMPREGSVAITVTSGCVSAIASARSPVPVARSSAVLPGPEARARRRRGVASPGRGRAR